MTLITFIDNESPKIDENFFQCLDEIPEFENNDEFYEEDKDDLHLISIVSSYFGQEKRCLLAQNYINHIENHQKIEPHLKLYIIEIIFDNQECKLKVSNKKNYLQIRLSSEYIFWNKENMINVAVKTLLPSNWKYMAWVDADIEFLNQFWVRDTIKELKNNDVCQLFSFCRFLNHNNVPLNYFWSSLYLKKHGIYRNKFDIYHHPGFAWACTRSAYDTMGGLFEIGITGSGDSIMENSFLQESIKKLHFLQVSPEFIDGILEFRKKVRNFRCSYIPGIIVHHYHGERKNRKYVCRHKILMKYSYNPQLFFEKDDEYGILCPTKHANQKMFQEIKNYFLCRKEE